MTDLAKHGFSPRTSVAPDVRAADWCVKAGDTVVFEGETLRVLQSGGRWFNHDLARPVCEVSLPRRFSARPQTGTTAARSSDAIPTSLGSKLARELGVAPSTAHQLKAREANLLNQVLKDFASLKAGADFYETLLGSPGPGSRSAAMPLNNGRTLSGL